MVEYHPFFSVAKIEAPTIIGGVTDLTPLYNLLNSSVFSFKIETPITTYEIPNNKILGYIGQNLHDILVINAKVYYNNQTINIVMKIQLNKLSKIITGNSAERFYSILTDMLNSLKQKMYSLSSYKETLDIMNTEIQNIFSSSDGNFLMVNDIQDRMNDLNEKMNSEFERIIYGFQSKNIRD